jgi:hypothetical protein
MPPTLGLARIMYIAWFANCVTVARLGDIYRGYLLKAKARPLGWGGRNQCRETRSQVETRIVPGLALQPSFWVGWLGKVAALVGLVALAAALVGVLLLRSGPGGLARARGQIVGA